MKKIMKKTFYSPRLEREFELDVCTPSADQIVGDGSDITIVRALALEKILFNDLAGAVNFQWKEIGNGAIIVDLFDDAGTHVVGVGDVCPKGLKNDVARSFPEATAWSRAISAAVVKYLGFEGRVYTDDSFEIEKEDSFEPTKSTVSEVDESEENPLDAATTVSGEDEKEKPLDPKEVVFTTGKVKGMKLGEIIESDDPELFPYVQKKPGIPRGRMYLEYMVEKNRITDKECCEATKALLSA